jgi:hypothetical protein
MELLWVQVETAKSTALVDLGERGSGTMIASSSYDPRGGKQHAVIILEEYLLRTALANA